MRKAVLAGLAAMMVVTGCATVRESRLNPFNWFGRSQAERAVAAAEPARDGGRVQVDQVTQLFVEPTTGGAIVRAIGVPPTQGWYLRRTDPRGTDGKARRGLCIPLCAEGSRKATRRQGTPMSREVTVATFLNRIASWTACAPSLSRVRRTQGHNAAALRVGSLSCAYGMSCKTIVPELSKIRACHREPWQRRCTRPSPAPQPGLTSQRALGLGQQAQNGVDLGNTRPSAIRSTATSGAARAGR
jgi:hypothetical protein